MKASEVLQKYVAMKASKVLRKYAAGRRMKASEVLQKYAAGEKDFRKVNIRGQSFKGENLTDADFSEADIRGVNFTGAKLRLVHFTGAKAGVTYHFIVFISLLVLVLIISTLTLSLTVTSMIAVILAVILATFTSRKDPHFGDILTTLTAVFGFSSLITSVIIFFLYQFNISSISVTETVFRLLLVLIFPALVGMIFLFVFGSRLGIISPALIKGQKNGFRVLCCTMLNELAKKVMISMGGTIFQNADLTDADFTEATLESTDFRNSFLIRTRWHKAKRLDCACFGKTYLQHEQVRQWLIGKGQDKNFDRLDLRGVNFQEADLTDANFNGANLSQANLHKADLSRAKLNQTQLDQTDLTGATLTGAYVGDWGITSGTKLDNVKCDYVYWQENQQERRPHDPNKNFAPGEFTKLFQKALETVDLIFKDGIEWAAFFESFQELRAKINNSDELSIQAIERKPGNAFIIRLEVPSESNKSEIEKYIKQEYEERLKVIEENYREQLQAKDSQLQAKSKELIEAYRGKSTDLLEMARIMANTHQPPITIENTTNNQQGDNNNMSGDRNINTGGGDYNEQSGSFGIGISQGTANIQNLNVDTNEPQSQSLAQAAAEIQQLLQQLEQTNPTATETQQEAFVSAAIAPTKKERLINALSEGGQAAIEEFLDNPYVNVAIRIIEGWRNP